MSTTSDHIKLTHSTLLCKIYIFNVQNEVFLIMIGHWVKIRLGLSMLQVSLL